MGYSRLFFLSWVRVFAIALAFVAAGEALHASCKLRLKKVLVVNRDSTAGKHATLVDAEEVGQHFEAQRQLAKDEGLVVPKNTYVRKVEQLDAWFLKFSNRLKELREKNEKITLEEFFGMIDAGFGRSSFRFEKIFEEYGIKNIRLLSGSSFDSKIVKVGKGAEAKDEVLLHVPSFPVDDPSAAAVWLKDLYLTLHDASTNMIAKRMTALKPKEAKEQWTRLYTHRVRDMDRGVLSIVNELEAYLKAKKPSVENPLNLSNKSFSSKFYPDVLSTPIYHAISTYKATDSIVGGVVGLKVGEFLGPPIGHLIGADPATSKELGGYAGGLAGVGIGLFTKVRFPLEDWKPSRAWLHSKEAYQLEKKRLDSRLASYYVYSRIDRLVTIKGTVYAVIGALGVGAFYYNQQSLTGGTEAGMSQEAGNTDSLDKLTDDQLKNLNYEELAKHYDQLLAQEVELNRQRGEALKKRDLKKSQEYNAKLINVVELMKKVMAQMEALSPEGIENER